MQELIDALNNGDEVDAEGNYYIENGSNIVKGVRFEVEENDDDGDDGDDDEGDGDGEEEEEFDFEGGVSSANTSSFIIDDETYFVNESTEFGGDIDSMQELIDALNNGDEVNAEGEYYINGSDENIVIEVEFDVDENDEGDDDEEDDD